jgi:hypothetical protein
VECDFRALAHKRLALVEKVRPAVSLMKAG